MPDGFGFHPESLEAVTRHLGDAESDLVNGIQDVPSIDAGRSTDWASGMLQVLVESGAGISAVIGSIRSGVDASKGSYTEVDENNKKVFIPNTASGERTWQELPPPAKPDSGRLMDAPDATNPRASTEPR